MGRKRIHSEEYWREYKRRKTAEWIKNNPERRAEQVKRHNTNPEVVERNRVRRKAIRDAQRAAKDIHTGGNDETGKQVED